MFHESDIVFSFSGYELVSLGFEGEGFRGGDCVCVLLLMRKLQMIIPSRVPPKLGKKNGWTR